MCHTEESESASSDIWAERLALEAWDTGSDGNGDGDDEKDEDDNDDDGEKVGTKDIPEIPKKIPKSTTTAMVLFPSNEDMGFENVFKIFPNHQVWFVFQSKGVKTKPQRNLSQLIDQCLVPHAKKPK